MHSTLKSDKSFKILINFFKELTLAKCSLIYIYIFFFLLLTLARPLLLKGIEVNEETNKRQ